jgi:hypothetical protein
MASEFGAEAASNPSFLYLLGDLVYHFGEDQYYYDQFYEPYRAYNAPIFGIPGNHDGMVYDPSKTTLQAFLEHFCSATPAHAKAAGGLMRTTMTQPGVYFTLEAPFVAIIGLYSNVLDTTGGGIISSRGGKFPTVGDEQLTFLTSELARLKPLRDAGKTAVVVAVHHPPYSADTTHGGSMALQLELDKASTDSGLWPDLVLSGHAHIYQRFIRKVKGAQIPYVVCGVGGFAVTPPRTPTTGPGGRGPITGVGGDHALVKQMAEFGYLRLVATQHSLSLQFNTTSPGASNPADSCTIDLQSRTVTP